MFLFQHPRRQRVGIIARQHRHLRLHDDRPAVQFGGDEMDAGPMLGFPGGEGAFVGVQAAKPGQQRGVNVEQPAPVMVGETGGQHPHEPGQNHQVRLVPVDQFDQRRFKRGPVGELLVIQFQRRNASPSRPFQALHAGPVADHRRDFDRQCPARRLIEDRLQIAAPPGNEHHQPDFGNRAHA